jgi:hypothetical protein
MEELQLAGVQVGTINGNAQREPGEIVPATEVIISVPAGQANTPVDDVVATHDAQAAMAAERVRRQRIEQNTFSAGTKLRAFYKETVELTDEEIDDANLLEMLAK